MKIISCKWRDFEKKKKWNNSKTANPFIANIGAFKYIKNNFYANSHAKNHFAFQDFNIFQRSLNLFVVRSELRNLCVGEPEYYTQKNYYESIANLCCSSSFL